MAPAAARESNAWKTSNATGSGIRVRPRSNYVMSDGKVVWDPSPLREQELEANVAERAVAARTGEPWWSR